MLARRPTLTEFYHSGSSMQDMRRREGHWFALVQSMGDLSADETAVAERFQMVLHEVETTAMTKSFKAVTLEAWLELGGLRKPVALGALAAHSRAVLDRRRPLLSDLDAKMLTTPGTDAAWARYWLDNPIKAWTGGNLKNPALVPFEVRDGCFGLKQTVADLDAEPLADML